MAVVGLIILVVMPVKEECFPSGEEKLEFEKVGVHCETYYRKRRQERKYLIKEHLN